MPSHRHAAQLADLAHDFCGIAALAHVLTLIDSSAALTPPQRQQAMADIHTLLVKKCTSYNTSLTSAKKAIL